MKASKVDFCKRKFETLPLINSSRKNAEYVKKKLLKMKSGIKSLR